MYIPAKLNPKLTHTSLVHPILDMSPKSGTHISEVIYSQNRNDTKKSSKVGAL